VKEYKVLREVEAGQPTWPNPPSTAAETTRAHLEQSLNELARTGWVVKAFEVSQALAGPAIGFRTTNLVYMVLLERERPDSDPPAPPA
jgi:hypothetical protein